MAMYTVKKGDTLSGIAKQHGVNYMDIAKENGISNPNLIQVGQTLKIGSDDSSTTQSTPTTTTPTQTQTQPQTETKAPTFEHKDSDVVSQANALLQQHMAQKPGEYSSEWQTMLNDTIQKILNREKFSYDLNGDMLYQQYKDQYTTQGKLASMDVMGQAAALTGGYGNSYAQTAGQQAYQGYLQQLNDKVPELYQLALNQYNAEGDNLYNQASLIAGMDEQAYGRHRDEVSDFYTDLNYLTDNARYLSDTEYQRAMDDFNIKYGAYRDQVGDKQWQDTFDEGVRQFNAQMDLSTSDSSNNSTGGNKDTGGKGNYDAEAAKKQQELRNAGYDVDVDGIWGPLSQAAWDKYQAGGAQATEKTASFIDQMKKDTQNWDAISRHMYGSEKTYIAQQIEKSSLTDDEKAYLVSYFGISENDLNYKKGHS